MDTVDAFEADIDLQVKFLDSFKPQKLLTTKQQRNTVFCGSGDSLAAAMLAEAFSNYSVTSIDPLEVARNDNLVKSKTAYFVSISGNTISNIRAAKHSRNSIAITRNPDSRLAKQCKRTIPLKYSDSGVFTAGSVGFVASMLACTSLVSSFQIRTPRKILASAKRAASHAKISGKVFFLGNQHTYPVAMYACAKLYEVMGYDAHYERMEQFFHMGLFSARRNDTVVILDDGKNSRLIKTLRNLGLKVYCASYKTKSRMEQVLYCVFFAQHLALGLAKKKGQHDCHFVLQQKLRNASSEMIY